MALVALDGTPLVAIGHPGREGTSYLDGGSSTLLDAAKEAIIMVGQIFTEDGGSHTIDTTGSSSLGWRSGAVTFANGSTVVKVGLAAVNTTTGPAVRAVNVADVITFDVNASFTGGGGGITATAWQESVPSAGTKTIANGDLVAFCVQMTAVGGADAVNAVVSSALIGVNVRPSVTGFLGGSYSGQARLPNAVVTFSDGTRGFFAGGYVFNVGTSSQAWNNTSGTKEYGNFFQMPVPAKIYGLMFNASLGGDTDLILYSDPLDTPSAQKTVSFDANAIGAASTDRQSVALFSSPYSATASQPLAGIMKPTTASNITSIYKTFNVSGHQKAEVLGANCYAINRASGAFAAQNSNKDRFAIGLLVGAFDVGGARDAYVVASL